jgi:predicted membrane-bound spermidine synthase
VRKLYLPWLVAFAEGFSTLAVEVIAIRLAVPVVGSSVVLTGVMLGVVLLALSVGYWRGGALSASWNPQQTRRALSRNLLIAAALHGAVVFPFEAMALTKFLGWGLPLPLAIGLAATVLLLPPLYLASQTVPMLAELTNVDGHAGRASGRILFFSTLGSVVGGVVPPVWLFPSIGVTRTGFVVCALLAAAAVTIAFQKSTIVFGAAALGMVACVAALTASRHEIFHFDSEYQTLQIVEDRAIDGRAERVLMISGGRASGVYKDTGETSFAYARAAFRALRESRADTVLVIGAAGFNLPRDASTLPYMRIVDAVDVDPAVKPVSEQYFLHQELPVMIRFFPLSARYAVRKFGDDRRRYGFTFLDAYFGQGIPEELVTLDFFEDVRRVSDRTVANLITDRDLDSDFSRNFLATFRQAFGAVWITDVVPGDSYFASFLVSSWPIEGATRWNEAGTPYRDDNNRAGWEFVAMKW